MIATSAEKDGGTCLSVGMLFLVRWHAVTRSGADIRSSGG
jgi:hypothetical protein